MCVGYVPRARRTPVDPQRLTIEGHHEEALRIDVIQRGRPDDRPAVVERGQPGGVGERRVFTRHHVPGAPARLYEAGSADRSRGRVRPRKWPTSSGRTNRPPPRRRLEVLPPRAAAIFVHNRRLRAGRQRVLGIDGACVSRSAQLPAVALPRHAFVPQQAESRRPRTSTSTRTWSAGDSWQPRECLRRKGATAVPEGDRGKWPESGLVRI